MKIRDTAQKDEYNIHLRPNSLSIVVSHLGHLVANGNNQTTTRAACGHGRNGRDNFRFDDLWMDVRHFRDLQFFHQDTCREAENKYCTNTSANWHGSRSRSEIILSYFTSGYRAKLIQRAGGMRQMPLGKPGSLDNLLK